MADRSLNQNALFDWIKQKASEKMTELGGTSDVNEQNIRNIIDTVMSKGYGISGFVNQTGSWSGSYVGSGSDVGYNSDISQLKSDVYKVMSLLNDVASHLQEIESRVTALEKKMESLNVGGTSSWYDGGSDGSDNNWNVDSWYKSGDLQTSRIEKEISVDFDLSNVEPDETGLVFAEIFNSENVDWFDYSAIDSLQLETSVSFCCTQEPLKGINMWFQAKKLSSQQYTYNDCFIEDAVSPLFEYGIAESKNNYVSQVLPDKGACRFLISVEANGVGVAHLVGKVSIKMKANLRAI